MVDRILSNNELSEKQKIGLISFLGVKPGPELSSAESENMFYKLKGLISKTVQGARVDHLNHEQSNNGFRAIKAASENGESLGSLHTIFYSQPVPFYFLVYVEVADAFRRNGLGTKMLKAYKDFLEGKSCLGVLDNIIPEDDPAYSIYRKLGWRPVTDLIGQNGSSEFNRYMVFIPTKFNQGKNGLKANILKRLLLRLKDKRDLIDIKSNDVMVKETIAEFKSLYDSLISHYGGMIANGNYDIRLNYAFTKFASLLISFRRKIEDLIGYTGGESLAQIEIDEKLLKMKIKSFPVVTGREKYNVIGQAGWEKILPGKLLKSPTTYIEDLPLYPRPYFVEWQKEKGVSEKSLTLGDLLDIGFDPTRLKMMEIENEVFIVERIGLGSVKEIIRVKRIIERIMSVDFRESRIKIDAVWPVCIIRTEHCAYVFRKKVDGIHLDEAVEMLSARTHLKSLAELKIDLMLKTKVKTIGEMIAEKLSLSREEIFSNIAFFVPWDIKSNRPKLIVEAESVTIEKIWVA